MFAKNGWSGLNSKSRFENLLKDCLLKLSVNSPNYYSENFPAMQTIEVESLPVAVREPLVAPLAETLPHSVYVKAIRDQIPPAAFVAAPYKLWFIAAHVAVTIGCYLGLRYSEQLWFQVLLSAVIGHELACLAFLAHELSHNAIIRNRWIKYPLEVVLWGIAFLPATLWIKLHNHNHHVNGNTASDPDRRFLSSELEPRAPWARRFYVRYFYPHHTTRPWNPFVWLHFGTYINRNLLAVFYPGDKKPSFVVAKPTYTRAERYRIFAEMVIILAMQGLLMRLVDYRWDAYLWGMILSLFFASTFVMMYVWTNHALNPVYDDHDPLACSTSVIVPKVFDFLHSRFSWHIEHHVFPSMNSDYYPLVGKLLAEKFPDRYRRVPIVKVWRELFRLERYSEDRLRGE